MEFVEPFIKYFVLYFVAIDPLGTIAIFLTILPNINEKKNKVAYEAVGYAFLILVFFLFFGRFVLNHLNIALYSFKIAGGIILFLISIEMLMNKRVKRRESFMKNEKVFSAIYPLAVPLLAGPASITSVIVLSSTITYENISTIFLQILALLIVMLITLLSFMITIKYENFINSKLLQVFSRIIAILLCALSIQFILDGIYSFNKTL